ncbi:glucan endo-1,3-beta-glucosidase 1-like [Salvia miltiorrhiza]|uniref:glucan endo-1,3-beta-glucosidase 1-like n=1 Tax=Salvia miltiorrhiza TaxID=226208 RepID=UPI0025AD7692|nr:glucan endo-1,3-beta-glucosidase 1-like [Salvia miltiorrhiza]
MANVLLVIIMLLSLSMCSDAQFEDYCVADEQYSEEELMYAMKWACKNGADCSALEEKKACFFPNTTKDHASYAFNSYYQNTKSIGGSCYFIAAAILTALNPSHGSCIFVYIPNP